MKAKAKEVVEKILAWEPAQCENDVIGIEEVKTARPEPEIVEKMPAFQAEEGEDEIFAIEDVICAQVEEQVTVRSVRENDAEHAHLISRQREACFFRLTFDEKETQPPK